MYLKAAKIPPGGRLRRGSGQSAWDYPQGSECLGLPPGLETLCPCHKKTPTTPWRPRQQSLTAWAPGPPRTDNSSNWERVL